MARKTGQVDICEQSSPFRPTASHVWLAAVKQTGNPGKPPQSPTIAPR